MANVIWQGQAKETSVYVHFTMIAVVTDADHPARGGQRGYQHQLVLDGSTLRLLCAFPRSRTADWNGARDLPAAVQWPVHRYGKW